VLPPPAHDEDALVRLLVVHPSPAVRAELLAACPERVQVTAVAGPGDLADIGSGFRLVVALDPARTPPCDVITALGTRPHILSISDLHLDVPDPAVDSTLPRRRLTRRSFDRHLRALTPLTFPDGGAL
jgi:hypothetical protein